MTSSFPKSEFTMATLLEWQNLMWDGRCMAVGIFGKIESVEFTQLCCEVLDQSWRRGKRTSTYGAAAKLVMRILTCLFIYLTRTQEVK